MFYFNERKSIYNEEINFFVFLGGLFKDLPCILKINFNNNLEFFFSFREEPTLSNSIARRWLHLGSSLYQSDFITSKLKIWTPTQLLVEMGSTTSSFVMFSKNKFFCNVRTKMTMTYLKQWSSHSPRIDSSIRPWIAPPF